MEELVAGMVADDEDARYKSASELADLGMPGLELALALLHDSNPRARMMACYVFANVADPGAEEWVRLPDGIPALIHLLEHERDEKVLPAAIHALGQLVTDHTAAGEAAGLLCALVEHPSEEVRYAVAHALGSHYQPVWNERPELQPLVRNALLQLALDLDEEVRDWAVFGLHQGGHDTPEVRACFWHALDDPHPAVRGEAATGLAEFGDRSLIPRLERLLHDEELHSGYFFAAERLGDPCLLPAVLQAEAMWRDGLEPGEEWNCFVTSAIDALTQLADHTC